MNPLPLSSSSQCNQGCKSMNPSLRRRWRKCCWGLLLAYSSALEYVFFVPGSRSVSLELISFERPRKAGQEREREKEGGEGAGKSVAAVVFSSEKN